MSEKYQVIIQPTIAPIAEIIVLNHGAIALLDDIISDYPNSQNTLAEYRDRLQQLSTTGLSEVHKLDYDCTNESLPKTEETPLSDRVESYNEQIEYGMSYDEVATIVGRPGKINFLMSQYYWYDEKGNYLYYADFSEDRLSYLAVGEKRDCEDDNPGCDNIVAPAVEFREMEARLEEEMESRLEEGMNAEAVLQQIVQELGEPTSQSHSVYYEWQFAEATDPDPNNCTLNVTFSNDLTNNNLTFSNDSVFLNNHYCLYDNR